MVFEGLGGHGLEGRISSTSMGQGGQAEGGVLKSLGERSFWLSSSYVFFLEKGGERWRVLKDGGKGENGLDVWGTLKNKSK